MLNILVVLYKKKFEDAETLVNINHICEHGILKNFRLIIWDNSTQKISEEGFNTIKKHVAEVILIHTPENLALSSIYNRVIDQFINSDDYLILLDHDTNVTREYFTEAINAINSANPPALLLPQIFVHEKIASPAYQYILFSKKWKKFAAGMYPATNVTAINSGMIISSSFFSKGFRYDERLRFYGTDTFFMFHYSRTNKEFYLLKSVLVHNLNLLSNPSIVEKAKVFKEIKRANLIVYSSDSFYKFLSWTNNIIIAIKYAIRYRSIIFFR